MQQKKQQKQGKRQEWKEQMKESDRMLKGNVLLEKPQWVLMLTLAAEFLMLVVLMYKYSYYYKNYEYGLSANL